MQSRINMEYLALDELRKAASKIKWTNPSGLLWNKCPKCGGRLEVLELVTVPDDAAAWLERLGLATGERPEPRARAPTARRGRARASPLGACVRSS